MKNVVEDLEQQVEGAVALLRYMTSDAAHSAKTSRNPKKYQPAHWQSPEEELWNCNALVFTFVTKAGLGFSVALGSGFLIRKVTRDAGTGRATWSAPLLLDVRSGGFGAVFGFSEVHTLALADGDAVLSAVKAVEAPAPGLQPDVEAPESSSASASRRDSSDGAPGSACSQTSPRARAAAAVRQAAAAWKASGEFEVKLSGQDFHFSHARNGALLDSVSLTGAKHTVNELVNRHLYGPTFRPSAVLGGQVRPAPMMAALYDELNRITSTFQASLLEHGS